MIVAARETYFSQGLAGGTSVQLQHIVLALGRPVLTLVKDVSISLIRHGRGAYFWDYQFAP